MSVESPLVMIVEDTLDAAQLMKISLRRAGIQDVLHAENGRSALDYLEMYTPDVLILDIGMPDMNGWSVLEFIKQKHGDTSFPVIMLTAYDDPANKLIGKLQSRVFRYLTKPFLPDTLIQTVRDAIASRHSQTV
jgi:CheY-like chemotaxis protein